MLFDDKALEWDNDPKKVERARIFAKEIHNFIRPNNKLTALEFGSGTGLLSYYLKDVFKTITLVDTSQGMMDVLKAKVETEHITNFIPIFTNLLEDKIKIAKQDAIYTLMTLHHISDLDKIMQVFSDLLHENGFLCIADLVHEDGSFHAHHTGFDGHNGFAKDELNAKLHQFGFKVVYYSVCYEIEKQYENGTKKYPLFLMIGKKIVK